MLSCKKEKGPEYQARLHKELDEGIDPRLGAYLLETADYVWRKYKKHLVITCLYRTLEENTAVGGKPYSAHPRRRAGDFRTWNLTKEIVNDIEERTHRIWGDFIYIKVHDSGSGMHIHVNIPYRFRRKWKQEE